MKCEMSRGIYLRADGRLPCYCAIGETITLGRVPQDGRAFDFVEEFYNAAPFRRIREMQMSGLTPFPGICEQCIFLDMDGDVEESLINSEVEWFQWEPSSLCKLDCQWCKGLREEFGRSEKARLLSLDIFTQIVSALADRGFRLGKGDVCGYGEPTTNKHVWDMILMLKEKMGGDILISTNGNGPFSKKIVTSGLTKIKIAIDGVTQKTYERYRKYGKLDRVIKFTKAIVEHKEKLRVMNPIIIWQYILFNYNDSDDELLRFQKMAKDIGVNQIRVVHTRASNYSKRNPEDFPKIFPDIIFSTTNQYSQMSVEESMSLWEKLLFLSESGQLQEAKNEAIKFLKKLYYRVTLGITSYNDFLLFAQGLRYVGENNIHTVSKETFLIFKSYILKTFELLVDLHKKLGYEEQAKKYKIYLYQIN
jgi:wyosine [tRNA(Phe)-imidazoG37] synthetase (radical SAM superfamily)